MYWLVRNHNNEPIFCMKEPLLLTKIRGFHYLDDKETYVSMSGKFDLHTNMVVSIITCIKIIDGRRRNYTANMVYTVIEITQAEYETYLEMKMFEEIDFDTLKSEFIKCININLNIMQRMIVKSFQEE